MGKNSLIIGSWAALFAAVVVWLLVAAFIVEVMHMQDERAEYARRVAEASLEEGQMAQLHALARDTLFEREILTSAVDADVLAAVNMIEGIRAGGAAVNVIGAQAEKSIPGKAGSQINVALLSLRAEGSFADVMRAAQMLETLPLATTVQNINIARQPLNSAEKISAAPWVLEVRLKFFTTAPLST